jgi:hypothetical protein
MSEMKEILRVLYGSLSLSKSPKATDILDYFEVSKTNITTKEGVKKGFKLGKKLR